MRGDVYMLLNKNIDKMKKEVEKTYREYLTTNRIVITTLATGAGMYLLGRSKALKMGYAKGRVEGYAQAVSDMASMVRDTKGS